MISKMYFVIRKKVQKYLKSPFKVKINTSRNIYLTIKMFCCSVFKIEIKRCRIFSF